MSKTERSVEQFSKIIDCNIWKMYIKGFVGLGHSRKRSQFINKGILISQTCFTKSKLCLRKGKVGEKNGVGIIPTHM